VLITIVVLEFNYSIVVVELTKLTRSVVVVVLMINRVDHGCFKVVKFLRNFTP